SQCNNLTYPVHAVLLAVAQETIRMHVLFGRLFLAFLLAFSAPIARAEPLPIAAFASLDAIAAPVLSPSGDRIAYLAALNGHHCLVIKAVPDLTDVIPPICPSDLEFVEAIWKTETVVLVRVYSPVPGENVPEDRTPIYLVAVDLNNSTFLRLAPSVFPMCE